MAARWDLASVRRVLDVDCGHGHWARRILPRLRNRKKESRPRRSDEKRALCDEVFENETRDFAGWDRETAERYFLAGGGDSRGFEDAWPKERARILAMAKALREDRYYANTASVFYLVSGRTAP
ncbi:MAG: hypothetical protein ABI183_05385 [Polyangiaceae bacterium]